MRRDGDKYYKARYYMSIGSGIVMTLGASVMLLTLVVLGKSVVEHQGAGEYLVMIVITMTVLIVGVLSWRGKLFQWGEAWNDLMRGASKDHGPDSERRD